MKIKTKYRYLLLIFFISAVVMVSCLPVSARYTAGGIPNAGINDGDTVFIGERNVDFSLFAGTANKTLEGMVFVDNEGYENIIHVDKDTNIASTIPADVEEGNKYYPQYSDSTTDKSKFCRVESLKLGELEIRPYDTDLNPCDFRPGAIPSSMNVQFILPDNQLEAGNFTSPWYEYELTVPTGSGGDSGTTVLNEIKNKFGDNIRLRNPSGVPVFKQPPAGENETLAFNFQDQDVSGSDTQAVMKFNPLFNGLSDSSCAYPFYIRDYLMGVTVDKSEVNRGDSLSLEITGTPYSKYTITLNEQGEKDPYFDLNGPIIERINDFSVVVSPDWSGKVTLRIFTKPDTTVSDYSATLFKNSDPSQTRDVSFSVTAEPGLVEGEMKLEDYDLEYPYAIGDVIKFNLKPGKTADLDTKIPYYFFIKGPNLPPNGAKLSDPFSPVVNGNASSFTVMIYNPRDPVQSVTGMQYTWDTAKKGLSPGTYTIYAETQPLDYEHNTPGISGGIFGSVEVPLHEPTVQAKFDEKSGSFFAQGDMLYSWWRAKGSPGKKGTAGTRGKIRWYIFGDNFKYADYDYTFPIYDDVESGGLKHGVPKGLYGFRYERGFTYNLSPGTYYIVYQHPMYNNKFDLLPDNDLFFRGKLDTVVDSRGDDIKISELQTPSAVDALIEALDSPYIDDTYVIDTFEIEKPSIKFLPVDETPVGKKLEIGIETNLASKNEAADGVEIGDDLILTIRSLDLPDNEKDQSEFWKITVPKSADPYNEIFKSELISGRHARPFVFEVPAKYTSTLAPGQYIAEVKSERARFSKTMIFDVTGEGYIRSSFTVKPPVDPVLRDTPYPTTVRATPTPDVHPTEERTPKETEPPVTLDAASEPQASGIFPVLTLMAVLMSAIILRRKS